MAHLTLSGITIPTSPASGGRVWTEIGDRARAFDGTLRSTRSALKREWSFVTPPLVEATADAIAALVQGQGHVWSFDTDLYSSKGLGKSAQTGTVTAAVAAGKFSNKVQIAAVSNVTWAVGLTGDYTLTVWRLEAAVWHHYVIRKTGGTTNKWVDGVSNDAASTPWLTVSGGDLVLGDVAVGPDDFDDLVALPFSIPTSWVAALYASTRAFPGLPRLEANGSSMSSPSTPLTVRGLVERETSEAFSSSGTWTPGGKRVEFTLEEV